ncbi:MULTISPECIES: GGDEF domain-containing protein [unclassified Paraburkholderia]|uniref:GGDEF domain-containing protein n=1 Tax=unclassified Paraburkholderia TaxID=2615204 RepID=UPI002AB2582A|nr:MULTISPECIES: GGDEF domain-containing protein [unclassified Paraburkholderia]
MTESTSIGERLRLLVNTVQHNERALQRFQHVELLLIEAEDFAAFLDILTGELVQVFDLGAATLWLDEGARLAAELHAAVAQSAPASDHLRWGRTAEFDFPEASPMLGAVDALSDEVRAALFGSISDDASVAILPLRHRSGPLGYLSLIGKNRERFADGMATDLLARFAGFVSAGLVNVAQREQLKHLGMTDSLTGLPNRRYFEMRLEEELQRAARHGVAVACLFMDLDHFKLVNDTHGHAVGDRVLAAVGACIRSAVRLGETVARFGGEEFVAVLQGDRSNANVVAERVRRAVEALVVRSNDGAQVPVTLSIGVAVTPGTSADKGAAARALIDAADRALYRAKRSGRNQVVFAADGEHESESGTAAEDEADSRQEQV